MSETRERYKCGGCGCNIYEIWKSSDKFGWIVKCRKCGSEALLQPYVSTRIEWLSGDGCICIY